MRQRILAGNWKMHLTLEEGIHLAVGVRTALGKMASAEKSIVLCPPFIHLYHLNEILREEEHLHTGGQNCHQEPQGAYTGEISAAMLRSVGAGYVILGHSERRQYFGEGGDLLARKVDAALAVGLRPIFCCGEPLEVREAGEHTALISRQLEEALYHLDASAMEHVVVAYEPVWAIGTGKVASPEQAQEMHTHIRQQMAAKFGREKADTIPILYGGSVKPENASDLFSQPDVDGGLIGGASLKASDFADIFRAL